MKKQTHFVFKDSPRLIPLPLEGKGPGVRSAHRQSVGGAYSFEVI